MTEFTPIASLIGGIMIGLSSFMLMAALGRISGISGITANLLPPIKMNYDWAWRIAFIIGLIFAPLLWMGFGHTIDSTVSENFLILMSAGLLVGFGSVWGHGCTSGHGVNGLARLSVRSIVATLTFMATGIMTVFMLRHMM